MSLKPAEEIDSLRKQVEVARRELKNIRSLIHGLKQSYRKDVQRIKEQIPSKPAAVEDEISIESESFSFRPIGRIQTTFKTKNGTPRQATIDQEALGILRLDGEWFRRRGTNMQHALDNLGEFSHVWLLFVFDRNGGEFSKAKVKPPRSKVTTKMGVFSTRSPHRPNPIGLSLARLDCVSGIEVRLRGVDLLDGTPILDIKPYIPDYDAPLKVADSKFEHGWEQLADSHDGLNIRTPAWVNNKVDNLKVLFGERANKDLECFPEEDRSKLRQTISVILSADPRSRYRREKCSDRLYFFEVFNQAHVTVWFDEDGGDSAVSNVLRIRRTDGSESSDSKTK